MLNDYEMLEQKVVEVKGLKDGKIRIGAISSITSHWLPQLIRNFKQRYPDVEFVMYQGDYDSIPRWIKEGVVDIGFTTPRQSNGLTVVPLKKGQMQAIIPENHPLAKQPGKPLPLSALADQPLILLEEGTYSEPLAAFDRAGVKPKVEYRIHDDYTIMNMVEKGLGISILANLVLLRMPFHFVRRPLKPRIMREIGVAFKSRQELPLVCQKFVDEIISQRDQLP
ncbi:LysR family transcriptional regulator substrate-binding protein [Limosilactobacillus coleohominis]|uniref:LysR family transcriptional regulator substrate-binding protein n=2 Tax=Limosilactobacillus coleohominis TaxID=181675 RepID=UPI001EF4665D|nr:LysR family transcriptional regulator substrate-binding protein [Limosilactobacillus coleohominis]